MLDDNTTADESVATPEGADDAQAAPAAAKRTAKKATAKKAPAKKAPAKRTTKKAAAPAETPDAAPVEAETSAPAPADAPAAEAAPAKKAAAKRTRKAPAKKVAAAPAEVAAPAESALPIEDQPAAEAPAKKTTARKTAAKKAPAKKAAAKKAAAAPETTDAAPLADAAPETAEAGATPAEAGDTLPLFQAPVKKTAAKRTRKRVAKTVEVPPVEVEETDEDAEAAAAAAAAAENTETTDVTEAAAESTDATTDAAEPAADESTDSSDDDSSDDENGDDEGTPSRRRRRRGGRRRRKSGDSSSDSSDNGDDSDNGDSDDESGDNTGDNAGKGGDKRARGDRSGSDKSETSDSGEDKSDSSDDSDDEGGSSTSRRRRRRRRSGDSEGGNGDDPENTVTRVRSSRTGEDQITSLQGSTRLEAKKQRRREGREAGRRRAPIVSEAEFLARREAVDRVMVIRQKKDLTQIAVLEDKVLVEHYVAREAQTSLIGNVYMGRVQNVLPSMEAAFIDIGKGRNAVLYAGEVNWSALGHKDGQARKIESVLSPGQPILVQVTKDPIGHKGARLTSQVSLAGRFLVYVPDGTTSGISRKLPDTERSRLKALLKEIVPDSAGVIVRTAAEGASEEELTRDVERLKARWEDIESKSRGNAPALLYGEPDLTLKVVRDLFTEDFAKLVIEGDDAWETVSSYVEHVAPDLADRVEKYAPGDAASAAQGDVFATYRIDEQIAKGLDRKVWLPSGGSLVIDRTEAMTVVDVNTGKFTGSGGNLEETVTKNNLEAAEEIVRQLRLRDIGGIIVVDFIDMVLESNRDLVVRRLVECLGRDRTRHQVAEVTSLGLVQMTRKRIGTGLLESFSHDCEHCQGRGVVTQSQPVESKSGGNGSDDEGRRGRGRRGGKGRDNDQSNDKQNDRSNDRSEKQNDRPNDRSEKQNDQRSDDTDRSEKQSGRNSRGRDRDRGGRDRDAQAAGGAPTPKDVAAMARHEENEAAQAQAQADVASVAKETPSESSNAPAARAPEARELPSESRVAEAAPAQDSSTQEASTQEPAADASPKVVTRTRRGASRRTAITTTTATAIVVSEPTPVAEKASEPIPEADRPKVVTRTRGRAAARPAGQEGDGAGNGASAGEAGEDPNTESVEHVPVKKKGTRKR